MAGSKATSSVFTSAWPSASSGVVSSTTSKLASLTMPCGRLFRTHLRFVRGIDSASSALRSVQRTVGGEVRAVRAYRIGGSEGRSTPPARGPRRIYSSNRAADPPTPEGERRPYRDPHMIVRSTPTRAALLAALLTALSIAAQAADPAPAGDAAAAPATEPAAAAGPAADDAASAGEAPVEVTETADAAAKGEATGAAQTPTQNERPETAGEEAAATAEAETPREPTDPTALYGGKADEIDAWRQRVDAIELGLATGQKRRKDVNALYGELSAELWPMQREVHDAIHADAPDLIEQHNALTELYALRSRLFPMLTRKLYLELTGLNPLGRAEAAREIDYFSANVEYQQHIFAGGLEHLVSAFEEEPLRALAAGLRIFFAILVFRWWRRWAKGGIPEMRNRLIAARPRTAGALRQARLLWYVDRVRRPLEWLALLWLVAAWLQPPGFEEVSTLVRTIVKWLFIGVATVLLIDARAARRSRRRGSDTADLRMRSLRLVGYGGVLFGLALDLTDRYAGTGVVHAWVVRGGLTLALPLLLLLLHWWKEPIFDRLEERAGKSERAQRLLTRRKGFGSYTSAALAGAYLLRDDAIQTIVRMLSGYEFGRRVVAQLVRREVAKEGEKETRPDETPIADEIILPLIAARDVRIDEIAKKQLGLMRASIEAHAGGARAVIGERGAGKTIFLERLAERFDGGMRLVGCPVGGYDALEAAIAEAFDIAPGEGFAARLDEAIEKEGVVAIGIDDLHRLPRPWLGGQRGLWRLASLVDDVEQEVSWVFSFDRNAWRYVMLAGGERAMLHDAIELPPWTEEQLAELVDKRADAIELEPDYEKLVLPRQLDAGEHDDDEQRNRFGYARILWELADGNPEVSLYLFAESMRRRPDGSVILRLPQLSSPGSLVNAHPDALLVLRALVQCDVASAEDLARCLQLPVERVDQVLRFCAQNGWVTNEHGGHRVSWRWFRSVTRALVRQNLMTR